MKKIATIVSAVWLFSWGISAAADIKLADWGFNINGMVILPGDPLPENIDAGAFNFSTGLGTAQIDFFPKSAGNYFIAGFFDHEIDSAVNSWTNEIGSASGTLAAGQSWEIDEPGFVNGDILDNFKNGTLDNEVGMSVYGNTVFPDDVSMAMGWNFVLADNQRALIDYLVSETAPSSGFFLTQTDPDSGASIYLSSSLQAVPLPGTWLLLGSGLFALITLRRKRRIMGDRLRT